MSFREAGQGKLYNSFERLCMNSSFHDPLSTSIISFSLKEKRRPGRREAAPGSKTELAARERSDF